MILLGDLRRVTLDTGRLDNASHLGLPLVTIPLRTTMVRYYLISSIPDEMFAPFGQRRSG